MVEYLFLTKNIKVSLSEQQIVDCTKSLIGNKGCKGGNGPSSLAYVKIYGVTTDLIYPYTQKEGTCQMQGGQHKIKGHYLVSKSEADYKMALQQTGPMYVSLSAQNWENYKSGIFSNCNMSNNHAVLLVGWDQDSWIIKNSWGVNWGESGYIRLKMQGNTCGIYDKFPSAL
jgi:hypothetical protein